MLRHGLTTADIEAQAKARARPRALTAMPATQRAAAAGQKIPKYRDHKTGATWTGHGRARRLDCSRERPQRCFSSTAQANRSGAALAANNAKAKGQPKGAQPPKYRQSGQPARHWSGRGRGACMACIGEGSQQVSDRRRRSVGGGQGRQSENPRLRKRLWAKKARAGSQSVATKKAAR